MKIERRAITWLSLYTGLSIVLTIFIPVIVFNPVRIPQQFTDLDFIWNLGDQLDGTAIMVDLVRLGLHQAVALAACMLAYRYLPLRKKLRMQFWSQEQA